MSDAKELFNKALENLGEAADAAKAAACAALQEKGWADTHWQPVAPGTTGAVAVPEPTLMDSAKSAANALVAKVAPEKQAFPNPYKDLTDEDLSAVLAKAFDGKTENEVPLTEAALGNLRATAAERNIKAVAPDRDCTLNDLRIGR